MAIPCAYSDQLFATRNYRETFAVALRILIMCQATTHPRRPRAPAFALRVSRTITSPSSPCSPSTPTPLLLFPCPLPCPCGQVLFCPFSFRPVGTKWHASEKLPRNCSSVVSPCQPVPLCPLCWNLNPVTCLRFFRVFHKFYVQFRNLIL